MKQQRQRRWMWTMVAVALAVVAVLRHTPARADDPATDSLSVQVPAKVKATVVREIGDGKVTAFSKETDADNGNQPFYRVRALIDGAKFTIDIDTDGVLLSSSRNDLDPDGKPMDADDLPKAVKATLAQQAGTATPTDISRYDRAAEYEMTVRIGGHKYVLRIDAAGRLISKDLDEDTDTRPRNAA